MPDGLDALDTQREQRAAAATRRSGLPRSRNQPASNLVPVPIRSDKQPAADQPKAVASTPERGPAPAQVVASPLVKTTVHLGASEDYFLDEVSFAGRRARPKVDASRSAVVRLALRRLSEQMTATDILEDLRCQALPTATPGRKRL